MHLSGFVGGLASFDDYVRVVLLAYAASGAVEEMYPPCVESNTGLRGGKG